MNHIKRYRCHNDHGLSLLEVLVSMIVLAVGILGLAPMVVLSIEGNNISRDFTVATELAKDQLEQHEALGELMAYDSGYDVVDSLPAASTALAAVDGYNRTVIIESAESGNPPNLCKVTVLVEWTDKLGQSRSISHSTLMMNN